MSNSSQSNRIVSLYPLTKFYVSVAFVTIGMVMPGLVSKLVCFVLINVLAVASGVWPVFIRRVRNSVGALFALLVLIQMFFSTGEHIIFLFGYSTPNGKD